MLLYRHSLGGLNCSGNISTESHPQLAGPDVVVGYIDEAVKKIPRC
jgi:hypothetical protein